MLGGSPYFTINGALKMGKSYRIDVDFPLGVCQLIPSVLERSTWNPGLFMEVSSLFCPHNPLDSMVLWVEPRSS